MEQDYLISNKAYDLLKRVVTVVLPAFATLYAALAVVWDLPASEAVVATCAALATFVGVLLSVAGKSWNESEGKYQGQLVIGPPDDDAGHPQLGLTITVDPADLLGKRTVRLRTVDETQ